MRKIGIVFKKILCLTIIMVLLTSHIANPLALFASELVETNYQVETTENEVESTQENEEPENKDSEDSNPENEEGENAEEPEQEDISNTEESADAEENESNEVVDENLETVENVSGEENNSSDISVLSLDDLQESIKATTKEDIEELRRTNKLKTKNANYEIRTFTTQFLSGADKEQNGDLVWTAKSTASGHEFTFRVNYALSGEGELPVGTLKITIPKSIIRNRNGNLDDIYKMSLPTYEEYEGDGELAYKEDGDYLVIFNPDEIEAGVNGYFEVSYATKSSTFNYKDYNSANRGLVKNGGTSSDPFYAIATVAISEESLNNISDDKSVYINTTAKIESTQKRYPTIYREWNSEWMQEVPDDSDDYYYLVWEIDSYISSVTQKYNFSINDVVTDLTTGTTGEDYELVGYKLAGERFYSNKNSQDNQTLSGYRYDYILTRHKKSTYSGIKYTLKNSETATVDPIDQVDVDTSAKSQNTFYWDPAFVPPTGHFELFKYGNNTGFGGNYANYDLEKLQTGEVNELDNFKYKTEVVGYAYPWTLRDGGSSDNPEDYGYNNVNYEVWDDTLYLEEDTRPVNYEDYYLDYFTYSVSNKDASFDDFTQEFKTESSEYEDDEILTFYGKFMDNQEWIEIGTYNLKTKEIVSNEEYVQEMTTSKIKFKPGVHATGWRYTTSNKHYYTDISVIPYYVLTNSDYVSEKIQGKDVIKLENNVSTKITDHNGETIFERDRKAVDYARVTYYDSEITKVVSSVSNNVINKNYNITWKVNAWETATGGSGEAEYIIQESGTVYDLIPLGGQVDLNSIQIQTEKGFLSDYKFTSRIIGNYRNSGRDMLIVNIDESAEYYTLYYKTVHPWDGIKDYGRKVLNPVAYESGNNKIHNGHPDNGGNLGIENRLLYLNLDPETDNKKFLYSEKIYDINALTSAISGLYKKVKSYKESDYSYDTIVGPDMDYSYKLRYQNSFVSKAKNLVFFDSLENFKVVDEKSGVTKTSGWKGTLQSVDITQLELKGIYPVIYISTIENLDLEVNNDLTDSTVWSIANSETDLSSAKAIAIDMRKDKAGNDFVLDAGDSITAILHMKSPDILTDAQENNPYTYNNVYIKNTLIDELGKKVDYYIHQDYTKVRYKVVADVPVLKVNAKDITQGIAGITFRLYGTSVYGTEIDEYITSNSNGYINFKDIEAGEYILQEYETTPDWIEDHSEHRVSISKKLDVYVDDILVTKQSPAIIKNEPRSHTDVTLIKKSLLNKNKTIQGAKFKLSGISDYGNEILMYGISDIDGKVTFTDIEKGMYELVEISTIEGYTLNDKNKDLFRVIVDDNSNYDIQKLSIGYNTYTKTRYSHTSNIDDSGYAYSNYSNNLSTSSVVTVPEAESLNVTVYYSTESRYDFVYVNGYSLGGNRCNYSEVNNYGYANTCSKYQTTIQNNSVSFRFTSDSSTTGYGYYAIITATCKEPYEYYESIYQNGLYEIYNEPLHSFSFTKKDLINKNFVVPGATFKVKGISDYGNYFEKITTSDEYGKVTFNGLEKGKYNLTEIATPNNYVLNTNTYTVTIDKMNNYTITGSNLASTENGYEIYNEPKHEFYFVKKDKYNNYSLGGAIFKLYGTSNIGNTYNEISTSVDSTGIVTFDNLESGTYFLKEIQTPDNDDVVYVPDEEERVVEVFENGEVKINNELIWPLSLTDENNPYFWYNTRNKGQITITKKWVDDLQNYQREEPKIYISTKRGELAYSKVYFRTADSTHSILDYVTSNGVLTFKRNIKLTEQEVLAKNPVRLDNDYDNADAEYKIYAWLEYSTVYWWTNADRAVLPANLDYYFQNESNLKTINWSTIYRNGFWSGTPGSETIQASVTNMQKMFYGCTSMTNLDISIINNSEITEETKDNMQYAFGNNSENSEGEMTALKYLTIGDNFKLFDTSVLLKGNWKNQTTNEKINNTELIGVISAATYKHLEDITIGKKIPYETIFNGYTLNRWRVFDIEEDYVYLIYGEAGQGKEYLPNRSISGKIPNITISDNYTVRSNNRENLLNAITTKSYWNSLLKGTMNGVSMDYTETTDPNVYANGSPTVELWISSWNKVHPEKMLYTNYNNDMDDGIVGNYIGYEPNTTSERVYQLDKDMGSGHDTLYFPSDTWYYVHANGYWLASPSANNQYPGVMLAMIYNRYGSIQYFSWQMLYGSYTDYALRPVICLPASALEY